MNGRYAIFPCLFALLACAGCGGPKIAPVDLTGMPVREATAGELVGLVNARADSVRALKADLALTFREGPGKKARGCSGKLLSIRGARGGAASIYLKGYRKLVPTFFTLVSDGSEFWLHVPVKNTVYTGRVDLTGPMPYAADTAAVDLEADDLSRALFVAPIDTSLERRLTLDDGHYVLEIVRDGAVLRRLHLERRMFTVVEETYYTGTGTEDLEVRRSRYTVAAGRPYPLHIVLRKPGPGTEITLEIEDLDLDPADPGRAAFRFEPPARAKIERIE